MTLIPITGAPTTGRNQRQVAEMIVNGSCFARNQARDTSSLDSARLWNMPLEGPQ